MDLKQARLNRLFNKLGNRFDVAIGNGFFLMNTIFFRELKILTK